MQKSADELRLASHMSDLSMKLPMIRIGATAVFAIAGLGLAAVAEQAGIDKLVGQPVDIAPWAYEWRADRAVQDKPEAYFIPRRLERIDKVYRTAADALPQDQLKSVSYNQPDLLEPLPPKPKGQLLAGLLWTGRLADYQVELRWPDEAGAVPSPEEVEVRVYPTSFGWFGWTVDRILSSPGGSGERAHMELQKPDRPANGLRLQRPGRCRDGNGRRVLREPQERQARRAGHPRGQPNHWGMETGGSGDRVGFRGRNREGGFRRPDRGPCGHHRLHIAVGRRPADENKGSAELGVPGRAHRPRSQARHRCDFAVRLGRTPGVGQPCYRMDREERLHLPRSGSGDWPHPGTRARRFCGQSR